MHFWCGCGNRISDTTDMLSYKGYILADQDLDDLYCKIEDAIMSPEPDRKKVVAQFFSDIIDIDKTMYQCPKCGRIFIDGEARLLNAFRPEEGCTERRLLQSTKGELWQGFLYAEWDDEKPEWSEHHGYVSPIVNIQYNIPGFDDYDAFVAKYYEVFEELKEKGIIRSAHLKRNRQVLHSWNAEVIERRWNF